MHLNTQARPISRGDRIKFEELAEVFAVADKVAAELGGRESVYDRRCCEHKYAFADGDLLTVSYQEPPLRQGIGHVLIVVMSNPVPPSSSHLIFGQAAATIAEVEPCIRRAIKAKDHRNKHAINAVSQALVPAR